MLEFFCINDPAELRIFISGLAGGVLGYWLHLRLSSQENKMTFKKFILASILALILGGLYATIVIEAKDVRQALLGGFTAEGFFVGVVASSTNNINLI